MSKARTRARRYAMQGIYEWQMSENVPQDILQQMLATQPMDNVDVDYLRGLLNGVPQQVADLDACLKPFVSRPLNEIDYIERAILRLATYELKNHLEVPYRVVINEAIELAKRFGAEDGHKFVNGILDKLAPTLRSAEMIK